MQLDQSFGRFVRQRRRELDLTQEELARRVGCAAITIRKIEGDDARPSVQIAERLAMALAIPLDDRTEFVRRGREARPEPVEIVTPLPLLEEIGLDDLTGRAIRGYALAEKIGAGGMGAVYRAVQPLVEREVAIKIILPSYANHPDFIRRFEAEAQLVARLEHPHIVPLYDYWREPGIAYLVMRLLRGGSVSTLLKDGALSLEIVNRVLEQVCFALHAAHRIGVIHRDLKPANVLLDEDQNAYLADFGIAQNLGNPNLAVQTLADRVVGSPAYLSPEQIQSGLVRPQTDIYCLGVMLYELLTGALPFTGATPVLLIQQHLYAPMPSLAARRAGLPATLDAVIGRATAKDPQERYADVLSLLDDFRRAATGLLTRPIPVPIEDDDAFEPINPYKGLRAFSEADAEDYFGREGLIQQLLARLGEGGDLARFLAVVGPSGSGKSSVVKAGLIPALRRGGLVGSENWFVVDFLPGAHPFEELEAALLRVAVNPPASLLEQLKDGERGLVRAAQRVLPADEAVQLVLVIDQFEEVFTLLTDEAERALFLSSLVTAVLDERSRVKVVITLRADFTDRPLRYVDFGELVQRRSELVLPLTPDEVERAILGPARRVGLQLESGLVATMIREVNEQPGALPLLQYALTELYEKREGRILTKAAYEAIGGVLGALGRRAEEVYRGLRDTEQAAARQIFLRLVTLGEGVEDTRRRVLRSEFESIDDQQSTLNIVLDAFGKHRLLTFDRDPITRGPTVEVAHEALLREWDRLRGWLTESRAEVRLERLLAGETTEWIAANREASFLLVGARLEQFEGWSQTTTVALTTDERAYLEASIAERDRQQVAEVDRQQRELEAARQLAETERARADSEQHRAEEQTQSANRLRTRNRALAVAGALVTVAAIIAIIFGGQASQNAAQAQTNLGIAQANAATAQSEAQVRATQQSVAEANFTRAESQRLAAEARALQQLGGDPQLIALLSLRSVITQYSLQGDVALLGAAQLTYPSRVFTGHTDQVWVVTFSPDGKYVLACSEDKTARLWSAQTGQELQEFIGHTAAVVDVAFSPDGKTILTTSLDETVRLWDVMTGQQRNTALSTGISAAGHAESIVFSPDGKTILTGNWDHTARLWDAQTGQEVQRFTGHDDVVRSVAFSPDGKYVLTGSWDHTAQLWDAKTGQKLRGFVGHTDQVFHVAFSSDGRSALTASWDHTARLWDIQTGEEVRRFTGHTDKLESAEFSPDGKYVLTGSWDHTARLWNARTGQQLHVFAGQTNLVSSVAFSPDGRYVLTGSSNKAVWLWDLQQTATELSEFIGHSGALYRVAFSPNGKYLATASADHTVRLWDTATGQTLQTFTGHTDWVNSVAFSPDGEDLLTGSWDSTARLWNARTGEEIRRFLGHADGVFDVAFSPDGEQVLTGSWDNTARLWETQTGSVARSFPAGDVNGVYAVAFSRDGQYALTSGLSNTAQLWNVNTGEQVYQIIGHTDLVLDVAFSPDGQYVLTASKDKTARLWDAQTGVELRRFIGHIDEVWGIAFSPNGRYVATASADGTARLWDTQTSQELRRFTGHTAGVESAAFSPDSKYVLTGSDDGTARLWNVDYQLTMQYLCSRLLRDFSDDERAQYGITDTTPTCPPNQNSSAAP